MAKLPQGEELDKLATRLGVDTKCMTIAESDNEHRCRRVNDAELQRRVLEAQRSIRESRLWWIAFVSALASLASAIAAWIAVAK